MLDLTHIVFAGPLGALAAIVTAGALGASTAASAGAFTKKPKVPTEEDVQEAKRRRMEEVQRRRGRGASIVTGGQGLATQPTLGRTSILGSP